MAFKAGAIYGEARLDTRKWDSALSSLQGGVSTAMKVVSAVFVGTMAVAINKADQFQKSMSNVATLVETDVTGMAEALLTKLDPALGNATELSSGLYQAISAGAPTAEAALQTVEDAAIFAGAALTDTNTAVDILTTVVNAYGREAISTKEASDILFTTIRLGKTTGAELSAVIGQSIPIFASAGINMEELAAGMAAMTKVGVRTAETTTQLNAIVNTFLKPQEELNELIHEYGFESGAALLKSEGLKGALTLLEEATRGDAGAMAELVPNIRAIRGVMALTGQGAIEFNNILNEMTDVAGASKEAFDKQEKTFSTFKNTLNNALIIVGNIAKTFTDEFVEAATQATKGVIAFLVSAEGMNLVSDIVATLAGTWSAFKAGLEPFIDTIGPVLQELWQNLATELGNLKGDTEGASTGAVTFAKVIEGLSSTVIVLGKVLEIPIRNLGNMIVMFRDAGRFLGAVFTGRFKEAGEAAKDFGQHFGENFTENFIDTPKIIAEAIGLASDEISTFDSRVQDTAVNIQVAYETAYTNTNEVVKENYREMITGQLDFQSAMARSEAEITAMLAGDQEERKYNWDKYLEDQRKQKEKSKNKELAIVEEANKKEQKTEATAMAALAADKEDNYKKEQEALEEALETKKDTKKEEREAEQEHLQQIALLQEEARSAFIAEETQQANITEELIANALQRRRELWANNLYGIVEDLNEHFQVLHTQYENGFDTVMDAVNAFWDAKEAKIENKYQSEIDRLDEQLAEEVITQEEYNEQKIAVDEERARQLNEIARKEFIANKANKISDAIASAASSIMGWWEVAPTLGPIAGPIFAATMTALTVGAKIAQIAAIASQEFVPRYAKGGRAAGPSIINEGGGEMVNLPDGSLVIPADLSQQIADASNNNGIHISVSFAGANISDNMDLRKVTEYVSRNLGKQLRSIR